MARFKNVNGVDVPYTAEEEAARDAEEAANVPLTPQQRLQALRDEAKAILASGTDARAKKDRAIIAILLDEINDLRGWITSFKAATNLATSLTDFKTRVAALANTPARTMSQAKTKYKAMVDSGKQDSGMVD